MAGNRESMRHLTNHVDVLRHQQRHIELLKHSSGSRAPERKNAA
jgi:hypothetical protein